MSLVDVADKTTFRFRLRRHRESCAEPLQMTCDFSDKFHIAYTVLRRSTPAGKVFFLAKVKFENFSVDLKRKIPHMRRKLQQAAVQQPQKTASEIS